MSHHFWGDSFFGNFQFWNDDQDSAGIIKASLSLRLREREGIKSWENDGNAVYAFHGPTQDICKIENA